MIGNLLIESLSNCSEFVYDADQKQKMKYISHYSRLNDLVLRNETITFFGRQAFIEERLGSEPPNIKLIKHTLNTGNTESSELTEKSIYDLCKMHKIDETWNASTMPSGLMYHSL